MYPTVLVMLTLDDRDTMAVDVLLSMAGRFGVQHVVLMHVVGNDAIPGAFLPEARTAGTQEVPAGLAAQADAVRAALPDASVEPMVGFGSPIEALDRLTGDVAPDLVVIGRHAWDGNGSAWGPSGQNLVRHAACSVLVAPQSWRGGATDKAIVGLDFSGHAAEAVVTAVRLFDDVVCLYQFDPKDLHARGMTAEEHTQQIRANAQQHFDEVLRPDLPADRVPALETVCGDRASNELVDRAGDDCFIVMGSRGMTPLAAMLLGSTAERVCGRSNVPVLVVRKKGDQAGLLESLVRR